MGDRRDTDDLCRKATFQQKLTKVTSYEDIGWRGVHYKQSEEQVQGPQECLVCSRISRGGCASEIP